MKTEIVRAWWPRKTNKGWRWLVLVRKITTIEEDNVSKVFNFFGFRTYIEKEVVTYEAL